MRGTSRDRAHRFSVHSGAHDCTFKSSTATRGTSHYVETSTKIKLATLAHCRSLSHNAPCVWSPKNPHLTLPTGLNRSIAPHHPVAYRSPFAPSQSLSLAPTGADALPPLRHYVALLHYTIKGRIAVQVYRRQVSALTRNDPPHLMHTVVMFSVA